MGMVQKVFWWIFWYAIVWFGLLCLIGGFSEIITAKPLQALLFFALFIVPGWYATRKVKQKALKKEMEQRTGNFIQQQPPVQPKTFHQPEPIQKNTNPPKIQTQKFTEPQPVIVSGKTDSPVQNPPLSPVSDSPKKDIPSLNSATVDDLAKLSGVNRILAMKIISIRDKDGAYGSFEDLFSRVQLTTQAQEEIRCHFSITATEEGRFIDF